MSAQGAGGLYELQLYEFLPCCTVIVLARAQESELYQLALRSCQPADQGMPVSAALGPDVQVVRRIDVPVRAVKWADSGELVALLSEASFYILSYDADVRFLRCAWLPCGLMQCRGIAGTARQHSIQGVSILFWA